MNITITFKRIIIIAIIITIVIITRADRLVLLEASPLDVLQDASPPSKMEELWGQGSSNLNQAGISYFGRSLHPRPFRLQTDPEDKLNQLGGRALAGVAELKLVQRVKNMLLRGFCVLVIETVQKAPPLANSWSKMCYYANLRRVTVLLGVVRQFSR